MTVKVLVKGQHENDRTSSQNFTIYGSPWTPQYGISAFQYAREEDIWTGTIPSNTDIVIVHGPPRLHLDRRDFHRAGCPYLAKEIGRVRPALVVFGHIHVSYGREDVVLDQVRQLFEDILCDWAGWEALAWVGFRVYLARARAFFGSRDAMLREANVTAFVNAAVVGGRKNELENQPIIVNLS